MLQSNTDTFTDSLWLLPKLPTGARVWAHKVFHLKSKGNFYSAQAPGHYIIRLVVRGRGFVTIKQERHEVKAGMIFCSAPGVFIEMQDTPEEPWEWLELQFSGEDAGKIMQAIGFTDNCPIINVPDWQPARIIRQMMIYYRREDRRPYKAVSMLYDFVGACAGDHIPQEQGNEYVRLVSMAQSLIGSQTNFDINVNELALRLGVERSTLFRAFRQELNMTPSEYLTSKRLSHAMNLLLNTTLKISHIASVCGFCCDKYFINWFKNHNGESPACWRRKHRT